MTRSIFTQFLSTNGDGTGDVLQNANYSVTPGFFYVEAPAGVVLAISHMHIVVADNATLNMDEYGAIVGGLTNGLAFEKRINGVVSDVYEGFRLKINVDFLSVLETTITTFAGTAQALLGVIFYSESFNGSLILNPGDYYGIRVNDNLASLVRQFAVVWGTKIPQ
jgi:hypothetical protein